MPTVLELELERLRRMTATEKFAVSTALWRMAWALRSASIATQHPDWTEVEVKRATRDAMSGGGA